MKKSSIVIAIFVVLAILHQDFWNWNNSDLWFGFLPAGLGYHAFYSVVVSLFWYLVSRYSWPHKTEAWADETDTPDAQ